MLDKRNIFLFLDLIGEGEIGEGFIALRDIEMPRQTIKIIRFTCGVSEELLTRY